jgi:hypothetical protein
LASVAGRVISERFNNQNRCALHETSKPAPISTVNFKLLLGSLYNFASPLNSLKLFRSKDVAEPVEHPSELIEEWSAGTGVGVEKDLVHAGSCRVITRERSDTVAWCPEPAKSLTAIQKKER